MCAGGGPKSDHSRLIGCENLLQQLMVSTAPGSFLHHLQQKSTAAGFVLPKANNGFPRMILTVSAGQLYTSHTSDEGYCSSRLSNEATQALSTLDNEKPIPGSRLKLAYDAKTLAGKVILSTAESWVDRVEDAERKAQALEQLNSGTGKIPAYTGFCSASGSNYHLTKWQAKLKQDMPVCHDGTPIWKVAGGQAVAGK